MPKLDAVLETALYVADLKRSVSFYQTVFELETLFADDRLCALNVSNKQVLLLFLKGASDQPTNTSGGVIPSHYGNGQLHVAFSIQANELNKWENWLSENGISIESRVRWARGGSSLYFRDPDGHLLELVTPGLWAIY
ncbi:MAG: VOC family protein [Acidobacteriota bacterium]|nr:VOC family protein [Acidobacteriota bacterium]